ncbi:distal tail protein Dit [Salipaludibacillus sp. CF4.18]|uniref:distal tail protein Dit n=1 Tax=Salipaludibacillus sp. CF4.18 TaxID=3373081 RepID=UPI003EE49F2A
MPKTITFNGIQKPWLIISQGKQRPPFAPINRNMLKVPGMKGAHLNRSEVDELPLSIPITIIANDRNMEEIEEELANWLVTEEPSPLIYSDRPNKTYYAVFDGAIDDFKEIIDIGEGTLHFVCPDPHKYGQEQGPYQFLDDAISIANEGTAEAYPLITATAKESVTSFLVAKGDKDYLMMGRPVDVAENSSFQEFERLLTNNMSSTTGWTTASGIDGEVAGTMVSNGTRFEASSYGTGSGWHGPAPKTSIPEAPLLDFRMEAIVGMWNQNNNVGRVEIYLLDDLNQVVGKMAMKDTRNGEALAVGEARLGDGTVNYHMINEYGDKKGNWNNFYGMLRLQRRGKVWYAYIAKIDQATGKHHTIRSVSWTDNDQVFTRNVSQIVVHTGEYGAFTAGAMGIYDCKVWRINEQADGVPYIVNQGDEIVFDMKQELMTINGEARTDLKDFGGTYFALDKGDNYLFTYPEGAFDTQISWISKYK